MANTLQKIVTIDGPAGAGKSTLARDLAKYLGWIYLDTGALYRALALTALSRGVDCGDREASEGLAAALNLTVSPEPQGTVIAVDGENITERLRAPEVSRMASVISAWPGVREALLGIQRSLGERGEVVTEGRDMGTVVFPQAGLKLFLQASPEARARRRHLELAAKGEGVTPDEVLRDIVAPDPAVSSRAVSPLAAAPGAVLIDSTNLDIEAVFKVIIRAFHNRFVGTSKNNTLSA